MTRCPPKPNPSMMDLELAPERINLPEKAQEFPEETVDHNIHSAPVETVAVERLRIKLKSWLGRFHVEREVYKRRRATNVRDSENPPE
jgi:hypothetical protein